MWHLVIVNIYWTQLKWTINRLLNAKQTKVLGASRFHISVKKYYVFFLGQPALIWYEITNKILSASYVDPQNNLLDAVLISEAQQKKGISC